MDGALLLVVNMGLGRSIYKYLLIFLDMKGANIKKALWAYRAESGYYDPNGEEIKTILKLIRLSGKILLDAGCHKGRLSLPLAYFAKKVVGIDINKKHINYCTKNREKKNVEYRVQNFEELKGSSKYDVILLSWVLFTRHEKVFSRLKAALRQRGKIVILLPFINSDREKVYTTLQSANERKRNIKGWRKFRKSISRYLKIEKSIIKLIPFVYPSLNKARVETFRYGTFKKHKKKILKELKKYERADGKVIINERIGFYVGSKKLK